MQSFWNGGWSKYRNYDVIDTYTGMWYGEVGVSFTGTTSTIEI
jgi:hypothetical protein